MWPHFVLMTPSAGLPLLLALLKLQIEIREASFQNSTESSFSNVTASLYIQSQNVYFGIKISETYWEQNKLKSFIFQVRLNSKNNSGYKMKSIHF